jgi:hypothetical protein
VEIDPEEHDMTISVESVAIDDDSVGSAQADGFRSGYDHVAQRRLGSGRVTRLAAWARSGSLDRELIAGATVAGSARLAARAAHLTAPRTRALIADGLERLLQAAQGPQRRWSAVGRGDPLRANAAEIDELAALLRGTTPLRARGIAILSELLSDGTGPAYGGACKDLAHKLHEARVALQS